MNNTIINLSITNFSKFKSPEINIKYFYKDICTQMSDYFVRTGIIIVCLYIFFSWFNWWFFNKGYKLISYKYYDQTTSFGKYIGNLNNLKTRIYWDIFIKDKLSKFMLGYIVVVIYLNW